MLQFLLGLIKWAFTFTYFPVVFLNPVFVLHIINTYASYATTPLSMASSSPHPHTEIFGPFAGSKPYLDMHSDDTLCWKYTAIMFLVQYFAFEQICDNRERVKVEKSRKNKFLKERLGKLGSSEEVANTTLAGNPRKGLKRLIYTSKVAAKRWMRVEESS